MTEIGELRKKILDHEKRLSKIESLIKEKPNQPQISVKDDSMPDEVRSLIGANIDEIKIPSLVSIILKFYGDLTKEKQIQILKKLGKKGSESLSGGNYARDIESKGLVHRVGKSGKDIIYSLTEKGKIESEQVLKKLKEKK